MKLRYNFLSQCKNVTIIVLAVICFLTINSCPNQNLVLTPSTFFNPPLQPATAEPPIISTQHIQQNNITISNITTTPPPPPTNNNNNNNIIISNIPPKQVRKPKPPKTNLTHLVFGLLGSTEAWHERRAYIESWWRPNSTRGYLFLDKPPSPELLPWSDTSPPYRISDDLTQLLNKIEIRPQRMVHGIMEVLRELDNDPSDDRGFRWLVMGDDDSIFFVDNMVDVLAKYDHNKYYYIGGTSENLISNYLFSFNQAYGGGGIVLSYPLAKALAKDMDNCLRRYVFLNSADNTTKNCIADIGVNLTPQRGNHQVDLVGDISGMLSSHPPYPLVSLHHFDKVEPIFPNMDRFEATRHLMKAAAVDHSRLLQQVICHHRETGWTFSVSWGYSTQIYESIFPRSYLQVPIETFQPWINTVAPPAYLFNTRVLSREPCDAPHVFFMESVGVKGREVLSVYTRALPRGLPPCADHPADFVQRVHVFSPVRKRTEMDRCECCDILRIDSVKADVRLRECLADEVIA